MRSPFDVRIRIFWDGVDVQPIRERVADARQRGVPIDLIRFGLMDEADTLEEAQALVEEHRREGDQMPITIYRRGTRGEEVLAEWDPGPPAWLQGDDGTA